MDRFFNERRFILRLITVSVAIIFVTELFDVWVGGILFVSLPPMTHILADVLLQVLVIVPLLYLVAFFLLRRLLSDCERKMFPLEKKNHGIEEGMRKRKGSDVVEKEFVPLVAHQLRNPISIINWYAEMLVGGELGTLNAAQKEYVDEISRNSKRMGDLVSALLNVSRVESEIFAIEPTPSDVAAIVEEAFGSLEPQIKTKKLHIEKRYAKSLPILNVDAQLVSIVVQNLLSNAIKYTPAGGTITCEISKNDSDLVIAVRDTGYGIPEKDQPKIFMKFFRADNARAKDPNGTGFGLYIVRAIMEESGGRVWFTSEENKGASFFVSIPLSGMKKREGIKDISPSL